LGLPVAIFASSAFCLARFSRIPINRASALAILIAWNTLQKGNINKLTTEKQLKYTTCISFLHQLQDGPSKIQLVEKLAKHHL